MFVGLVKDPGWGLPDDDPQPARRTFAWPAVPWRLLVWLAVVVVMFAVSRTVGGWAGYVLMLVALAAGSLRLDRQLGPVARGMRDYQA